MQVQRMTVWASQLLVQTDLDLGLGKLRVSRGFDLHRAGLLVDWSDVSRKGSSHTGGCDRSVGTFLGSETILAEGIECREPRQSPRPTSGYAKPQSSTLTQSYGLKSDLQRNMHSTP